MLNQIYIRIDITVFTAYPQPQRIERRSGALIAGARTHARTHTLPHSMLWRLFLLLNKDFIFDFNGFILILS